MGAVETLKKTDRTLLEMWTGILLIGLICQAAGAFLAKDQLLYAASLWFGIALSLTSTVHMYRSLCRAFDFDAKTAAKMIFRGYLIRYSMAALILGIIAATEVLNPLVVMMAYMSLKVTALLQPITHKAYNKLFHEEDPVPMPVIDVPVEEQIENE